MRLVGEELLRGIVSDDNNVNEMKELLERLEQAAHASKDLSYMVRLPHQARSHYDVIPTGRERRYWPLHL